MNVKQISNIMNKYPEFIPQSRTQINDIIEFRKSLLKSQDFNELSCKINRFSIFAILMTLQKLILDFHTINKDILTKEFNKQVKIIENEISTDMTLALKDNFVPNKIRTDYIKIGIIHWLRQPSNELISDYFESNQKYHQKINDLLNEFEDKDSTEFLILAYFINHLDCNEDIKREYEEGKITNFELRHK